MTDKLLTTREAAERLGVSPERILAILREDTGRVSRGEKPRLPGATKPGRDWLIPEGAVRAYKRLPRGRPRKQ